MVAIKIYLQVHTLYSENKWLISLICVILVITTLEYLYKLEEREISLLFAYPIIFN